MGKPGEFFIQPRGAGRVAAPADHNLQGAESELQCGTGVRAAASLRPGRVKRVRVGEANLQQKDKYLQTYCEHFSFLLEQRPNYVSPGKIFLKLS